GAMPLTTVPRRTRRTPWWTIAALCLALPAIALLVARAVPWGIGTPWIQLLAALPYAAGLLLLALLVSLLSRGKTAAAVSGALALALLVQLVWLAPRFFPAGPQASGQHQLTVMSVNVDGGRADVARIVSLVKDRKVDVLALVELNPDMAEALDKAGISAELPFKALSVDWSGTGAGLYARYPLADLGRIPDSAFYQTRAAMTVPWSRSPVWLTAVHADSPRPGHTPTWRADLQTLAETGHAEDPVILLGDFNASLDHHEFRQLLAAGYTDAAQSTGRSLLTTWPENAPVPPFVAIDHVLTNGKLVAGDFTTIFVPKTDHAAVWATLSAPR
ncbi:MAG TPA: endonuclease/exonuclease/phosphatase family protein, partial [Micrococcaceae bacterium]